MVHMSDPYRIRKYGLYIGSDNALDFIRDRYRFTADVYPEVEQHVDEFLRQDCGIEQGLQHPLVQTYIANNGHGNIYGLVAFRDRIIGHFGHGDDTPPFTLEQLEMADVILAKPRFRMFAGVPVTYGAFIATTFAALGIGVLIGTHFWAEPLLALIIICVLLILFMLLPVFFPPPRQEESEEPVEDGRAVGAKRFLRAARYG